MEASEKHEDLYFIESAVSFALTEDAHCRTFGLTFYAYAFNKEVDSIMGI